MARSAKARPAVDPLGGFHEASRSWFRAALGEPTLAQAMAWPHIAAGKTTLLLAPTGSGKTLAAFFSAIDRLANAPEPEPKKRLKVLYVSPLKALAVDVERNLRAPIVGVAAAAGRLGAPMRQLEVAVRTGDTPAADRTKMLRAPPDVLITTPESLYLLLTSSQREILTSIETVIIDEIHQMAASKRGAHLFLSLERLEALRRGVGVDVPLQRVGLSATQRPLEEIAKLLGGAEARGKKVTPRPVEIVDASAKKTLSITVEVPPPLPPVLEELRGPLDDLEEEEDQRSIWPQVHARLVERVRMARSTMIFVNSRRLAERLATALNETAGEEIALAHHGSVAKETRRATEERLKAGNLPCIVATSSLELGIDMGAVDQVIQVEAPPSIASGIQRIGRASHHVGGVPSGVLVPKHKHDLLACAAAATGIEDGDVETTYFARNPLDVLAQQIVAIAAIGLAGRSGAKRSARKKKREDEHVVTDVEALWDLVRGAAPFADLPRSSFDGVLDMLAGRYPSDEFADLRPRITWDRTAGTIAPRAGAQRLAILNGGTIPDRGLYGVFLKDDASADGEVAKGSSKGKTSRRVGELDEEMVFELREGEVFLLGASSWRAEEITRDRVLVTPAAGIPGKMPFWHGDRAGRTVAFGARIGKLTRRIAEARGGAIDLLRTEHHLDGRAANDLVAYVAEEVKTAGAVPSDKTIVVERVPDELGDLRICVLTPFGARVHAPWAMAALARLREERAGDIEAVWSDDGMVFRVPGGESAPPTELLLPSSEEIEDIVTRELAGSSLFAARFRESAARALLLPRQSIGKRTPLWAQRKRSADLLAVASQYPAFPIVLETYREVLRDAFDLPGLVELLRAVEARKIRVVTVDAPAPSPFASSLLFAFVGNFIYDEDAPAAERRAQALTIDHAQLRELLGEVELRKLLDPEVVLEHERMLQRLEWPLKHADAVHDVLLWLGDLSEEELAARSAEREWIDDLVRAKRVVRVRLAGEARVVAVEDVARYRDALGIVPERGLPAVFLEPTEGALASLAGRWARTHGPFTAEALAARWGIGEAAIVTALEALVTRGKLTTGAFLPLPAGARADAPPEYVDVEVLRALKQKTLARLRKAIEPVAPEAFARFLVAWQGAEGGSRGDPSSVLLKVITQLEGCPIPFSVLEREVLPARVPGFRPHHLDQLFATGEVVWAGVSPIGSTDGRIALYLTEREALLAAPRIDEPPSGPLHVALRDLFARRGAVFFAEIARTIGGYPRDVLDALWDLVWSGEVTNDALEPLRSLARSGGDDVSGRQRRHRFLRSRGGLPGSEGRWSLRSSRWAETPSPTERAAAISRALLERYGVVLREAAAAEGLPGGFSYVYDVYRAMEEQGRLHRGYFVAGRGATQFALPGAEERLRSARRAEDDEPRPVVLAATDPANPYGGLLPWPAARGRTAQRAPGARVVLQEGRLLAWIAKSGRHVATFFAEDEPARSQDAHRLARVLAEQVRVIVLDTIDGEPARDSPFAPLFAEHGFARRQGELVRIPETTKSFGRARLGARPDVGIDFDFGAEDAEDETASDDDATSFDTDFEALDA
ncbi:MAG: DEAD/DEAH box helicase [Labilithrix sp.]|nr:DEAD/DEAH box helicase [Labilithrix sp.]MCW5814794.1 DEAD/DEAH box helicase [Labilithrix sp.]